MKDFSSIKEKILLLRDCGVTHCVLDSRTDNDSQKSLLEFGKKIGFSIKSKDLKNIEREQALDILKLVLKEDLAYSSQIMPDEQAEELARDFCNQFQEAAKFFTNGSFEASSYGKMSLRSWNPITKATFNTGVFIIDEKSVGCLWVEDED